MRDQYLTALGDVPRKSGETGIDRKMREISHLHLTRCLQNLLDRMDRMSMANSVELRVPLCDHRLVEYMFNIPWELKNMGNLGEKGLLKTIAEDILPASVVRRRKSAFPTTRGRPYEEGLRRLVTEILHCDAAPVLPLLDRQRVEQELQRPPKTATSPAASRAFSQIVDLNMWLSVSGARLRL